MQFHTRESFEAKQITHKAYERLRNLQTTEDESGELHDYQREVAPRYPYQSVRKTSRNTRGQENHARENQLLRDAPR